MKTATLKTQAGFSLVELMVVVAIIGILASMSAGQVQKQIATSRQAEAKTNLATVYTSMKAFQAEWSGYTTDFSVLSAGFEGNMRYRTGFTADHSPSAAIAGYTGAVGTLVFETGGTGACNAALGPCTIIQTGARDPSALQGSAGDQNTFIAASTAQIFRAADDTWTINQNKIVSQIENGL
jgi:type IV pilus assembly protein PilA